jgi:predicted glutamine amidotransferase
MCRLAAYIGPAIPLARVVIDPAHSLLEQSQCATEAKISAQGDGFGFAWYDGDIGPGLYRDVLPAWSDGNLPSLCHMIRSDLFLAHVRASTTGETSRVNCHPFTHTGWSFMHNGQVPDIARIRRTLETELPDELYDARRGTTDSELMFLLLLANGLMHDPLGAVRALIAVLKHHSAYGTGGDAVRLTCVFSDGRQLYAFRHASDARAPTLYAARSADQSWTLASEPLDGEGRSWRDIPVDTLVTLTRDTSAMSVVHLEVDLAA